MSEYRKPQGPKIGAGETRLYELEGETVAAFKRSSKALGNVLGLTDYYHEILPEALYAFFEQQDPNAVVLAIQLWLEKNPDLACIACGAPKPEAPKSEDKACSSEHREKIVQQEKKKKSAKKK